jgi:hypothetical protein
MQSGFDHSNAAIITAKNFGKQKDHTNTDGDLRMSTKKQWRATWGEMLACRMNCAEAVVHGFQEECAISGELIGGAS